jgi:uncharacterized radical SAM superfamily Fe-S cluster-containing enzyme
VNAQYSLVPIDKIKADFEKTMKAAFYIKRDIEALEVIDDETKTLAVSLIGDAKRFIKIVDKRQDEIIEAPKRWMAAVKNIASVLAKPLQEAAVSGALKVSTYNSKVELARREAEKKAQEEAAKLQAKINKQAEKKGVEAPVVPVPVIPPASTTTKTDTGTTAYEVKRWIAIVHQSAEVPREYCSPDMKLINEAVKNGVRTIPGVEIKEISETRFRT